MSGFLGTVQQASGGLWPYLAVLAFGFLPSEFWRWISVFLVRGLNEDAEILVWVRAVATALLAAVVAKLLLSPPSGAFATIPPLWRWAALAGGCAAFLAARKRMFAGVVVGEAMIVLAGYLTGG